MNIKMFWVGVFIVVIIIIIIVFWYLYKNKQDEAIAKAVADAEKAKLERSIAEEEARKAAALAAEADAELKRIIAEAEAAKIEAEKLAAEATAAEALQKAQAEEAARIAAEELKIKEAEAKAAAIIAENLAKVSDAKEAVAIVANDAVSNAEKVVRYAEIDAKIANVYGIHPFGMGPIPKGNAIIYSTMSDCQKINGSPYPTNANADQIVECKVDIGSNANMGLHPHDVCPNPPCYRTFINMTGGGCRKLGGLNLPFVADDREGRCYFNVGTNPQYGFYPHNVCPDDSCSRVHISMPNSQCQELDGKPVWGTGSCYMNIGPAKRLSTA